MDYCSICGKVLTEANGYECGRCGELVCEDCYNIGKDECLNCESKNNYDLFSRYF